MYLILSIEVINKFYPKIEIFFCFFPDDEEWMLMISKLLKNNMSELIIS